MIATHMSEKRYALFDLDYTLIPHDTLLLFCNYVLRRHFIRRLFLVLLLPVLPLVFLRIIRSKQLKQVFLSFLAGLDKDYVDILAKDFVKRSVLPRLYPEIVAEVKRHKKENRITVLNTAAPFIYSKYIAEELQFDHVYATVIEMPQSFPLIAKIKGNNNKRYAKIEQMMDLLPSAVQIYLKANPPASTARPDYPDDAILYDSWSYSDSAADLPMLRLTEQSRLVNPNNKSLITEAEAKGWTILKPMQPYNSLAGNAWHSLRQLLGLYPD